MQIDIWMLRLRVAGDMVEVGTRCSGIIYFIKRTDHPNTGPAKLCLILLCSIKMIYANNLIHLND